MISAQSDADSVSLSVGKSVFVNSSLMFADIKVKISVFTDITIVANHHA